MLIGIDASRALRPQPTGTERYSLEIIRHLLALPEAGNHRWRLYTDRPPPGDLFTVRSTNSARSGISAEICNLPARRLWTHRSLAREVLKRAPDVLFVPAHVLPAVFPPHRLPPSVVTIHDLGYHYFPAAHTPSQRLYLQLSTRWAARAATRLIAVSYATALDLRRFYHANAAKIRTIHEGANRLTPPPLDAAATVADRYRLPRPYALFVGTIQPRKNLARLIDAYGKLVARHAVPWDLVLAGGKGWQSEQLYAQADRANLSDLILFAGYVPPRDLPALMRGARMFCFPSLYEGFGLPVLEAQSLGVPVMTANNSSLPEVAGEGALLVDPTDVDAIADAMLQLSQDEALRQELIAAGHENVKRFSWEKAAQETLVVLEGAATSHNGA